MRTPYDLVRNTMARMFGQTHGGVRDTYAAFGYPQILTPEDFFRMYLRNGVASRVIRAYPQATWRDYPLIRDEQGDSSKPQTKGKVNASFSKFVKSVEDFFDLHDVMHYLERADRLSSIGRFGILIMGFDDGGDLSTPLPPGQHKLKYLSAYGEPRAGIESYEKDQNSERYALPTMYTVKPESSLSGSTTTVQPMAFRVHHSRVIHLAEFLDENEVLGTPRLMPVYNHIQDLEKVVGSGAETFWLNARGGMSIQADKDATIDEKVLENMKQQAEEFEHQLRRIIALQGATAQMLTQTVADPKPNVEASLQLIAGGSAIPLRILIGSERGELSSEQDENNWAARIDERQKGYATPKLLNPFVQRMIDTGNIIRPSVSWWVEWPSSASLSPVQEADVKFKKTQALTSYANAPGASLIVPEQEFRTEFLGLPPESDYDLPEEEEIDETDIDLIEATPVVIGEGDVTMDAEKPQDTALNGAQIASLKGIIEAIGLGTLAPETAVMLIGAGFPAIPVATAKQIVDSMVTFLDDKGNEPEQVVEATKEAAVVINRYLKPWREFGLGINTYRLKVNAAPQSLYVKRQVLNAEAIRAHYRAQGIEVMTPAEDMHVTMAYSKRPVDWFKIEPAWNQQDDGRLEVPPGGARMMSLFGKEVQNVLVLQFSSSQLSWRFQDFINAGASWDWPDFQPHLTISYDVSQSWGEKDQRSLYGTSSRWEKNLSELNPWQGVIELGPEVFAVITEDWSKGLKENARV